jgi:site-specific DNA recombinase
LADLDRYYLDLLLDAGQVRQRRARRDLYSTSVPHYGHQHSGDPATPPVVVEEEAKAVRLAFERYATGKRSYQEIADELNEAGFHTRRGRRFSKETVSQILSNPFYAGQVVYDEGRQGGVAKVYPGKHEAIVSEPLWNAARIARDRHRRVARKPQRQVEPYLLSRIACCHICGHKLRTQTTPGQLLPRDGRDPRPRGLSQSADRRPRRSAPPAGWGHRPRDPPAP